MKYAIQRMRFQRLSTKTVSFNKKSLFDISIIKLHHRLCTINHHSFYSLKRRNIMLSHRFVSRLFSTLTLPATTHSPRPFVGDADEIVSKRLKHFSNIYQTHYKTPLVISEGHMQYLYDHKGNRFIDLESNDGQVNIGHNHPAIKKVIQDQAGRLIHTSTIYMSETQGEYSKLLLDQLGPGFETVYLCNSTGEAIDFSIMLSRVFTEEKDIYAFRHAYHGLVGNARTVTNLGSWNSTHVDRLDCVRLAYPKANGEESLRQIKDIVKTTSANKPGTLVYEPLQAKGGVNIPAAGFLKRAAEHFKGLRAVTICDESNTGLGRIGKESWGFKWQDHVPDIITIGSALGNGSALSAVVTRKEIASVIKHAWFNTFAAGHMQTKLGIAVINTINSEKLHENAENVGRYLLSGLQKVKSDFVGEVRGKGLLIGIDILQNGEPSKEKALELMELTRERQLLFGRGGPYGNVLLVRPPLCITQDDAQYVIEAFQDAVTKLK